MYVSTTTGTSTCARRTSSSRRRGCRRGCGRWPCATAASARMTALSWNDVVTSAHRRVVVLLRYNTYELLPAPSLVGAADVFHARSNSHSCFPTAISCPFSSKRTSLINRYINGLIEQNVHIFNNKINSQTYRYKIYTKSVYKVTSKWKYKNLPSVWQILYLTCNACNYHWTVWAPVSSS